MPDKPERDPFEAPTEAVAMWLDGAGSTFAQREVTPASRKPFIWKLVGAEGLLRGASAKLVLPLEFPAQPAEVHVGRDLCLVLPHVEESGKVCLGTPSKPGDYASPAHAVADTLQDFESFLSKITDETWIKDEFQRERLAYWGRYCEAYKRRRGFPSPRVVQVVLPPFEGHVEGNLAAFAQGSKGQGGQHWLATTGDTDANELALRHGWAKGTLLRGHVLFIEMPEDAEWTPTDWPESLSDLEQLVAQWSNHELSLVNWIESKCKKEKRSQPFLIALMQGNVAFGFCLAPPLIPGLTAVGLVPLLIERVDADWALARDHELTPLQGRREMRVLLLGCGSLGSLIAELLARAGIGHLTVVDMELFKPENTARHVLGFSSVNKSKAVELAARLRREIPGISVEGHFASALPWLAREIRDGDLDLVLDCTGESSVRCFLSVLASNRLGSVDIAHLWMEPFCAAAHVVYLTSGDTWPSDDPADTLVNIVGWPSDVQVHLPACGAGFHPYGASDVWQVAGFAVERLLAHLDGTVGSSTVWTWTRGTAFFDALKVKALPGLLVPETRTRFECVTLERPFAGLRRE